MANSADTSSLSISELEAVLRMMGKGDSVDRIKAAYPNEEQYRIYLEAILRVRLKAHEYRGMRSRAKDVG